MQEITVISLVISPGQSVFDAREEILMAADWYKAGDNLKISLDALSKAIDIYSSNQDFIDYLNYTYNEKSASLQKVQGQRGF